MCAYVVYMSVFMLPHMYLCRHQCVSFVPSFICACTCVCVCVTCLPASHYLVLSSDWISQQASAGLSPSHCKVINTDTHTHTHPLMCYYGSSFWSYHTSKQEQGPAEERWLSVNTFAH